MKLSNQMSHYICKCISGVNIKTDFFLFFKLHNVMKTMVGAQILHERFMYNVSADYCLHYMMKKILVFND